VLLETPGVLKSATRAWASAWRRRMVRLRADALPPAIALGVLVATWEVVVRVVRPPEYLVPAPSAVFATLFGDLLYFLDNARATLLEAAIGLAMGTAIGLSLGAIMAQSRLVEKVLYPIAVIVRSTPTIAIAPLFLMWFGFTVMPKATVAALATFFPVLVNAIVGLRSVDPTTLEFLHTVHASRWEVFWRLRVPSALPYLFASLRLGVSLSLIGAIVGELVGAREGLGKVIDGAAKSLLTTTVFGGAIILTLLGVVLIEVVGALEARVIFWHESQRGSSVTEGE
jgi:NitT/TauT family transport system permease protein